MSVIQALTSSNNPTIALLAGAVLVLSSVVVYQWNHTANKTVPKWIWDMLVLRIDSVAENQKTMTTIIDERLKKNI